MGPRSPDRGRSALCRVRVAGTMPGGGPGPCAHGRDDGRAVASHRGRGAGRGDRASRWSTSAASPTPPRAGGRRRIARHVPSRTPLRRAHTRIRLGYGHGREGPAGPEVCPSRCLRVSGGAVRHGRGPVRLSGRGRGFVRTSPVSHVSRLPPSAAWHVASGPRSGGGHHHPDPVTAATGRGAEGQGRGGGAEPPKPPQHPASARCRTWHVQDTQREAISHMDRETSGQPAPTVRFGTFRPLRRRCRCCTGRRGPAAGSWRSAGGGRAPRRPTG